jgi:CheY-like chemotaxis protein
MNQKIERVLLIDDDEDDCLVFKMALDEAVPGTRLFYKNCCDEFASAVEEAKPDLIFLDINMPRVNGIECLERIEQSSGSFNIPIIIYSSSEHPRDLTASYQKGAALYFRKPANITHLIASLKNIFQMDWHQPSAITSQFTKEGKYQTY